MVGRVGADPEIRTFESGKKTAKLRLATTERSYNKETKEATEYTEWHTVILWESLAEVVDKYIHKGSLLYIVGSIRTREWSDASGAKRYSTEIQARGLKMLGPKPTEGASNGAGTTYQHTPQEPAVEPTPTESEEGIDALPF